MAREIERKLFVRGNAWLNQVIRRTDLRDGLLLLEEGRKLRVRIADKLAFLTFKSRRHGAIREEFEYPIPLDDAEALLERHCDGRVVEKSRHEVLHDGISWSVDVYRGRLEGIVIGEAELAKVGTELSLPVWLGREITDDKRYHKSALWKEHAGGR